jgi:hypothetical protein
MLSLRSRAARRAAGWTSGASVVVLGLFALLVLSGSAAAEAAPCAQAPVVCENELPGSPASEWDVAGSGDSGIQGFATDLSVDNGSTVRFKVDTTASDYRLDIYRLGYYGGLGARKVASVEPSATLPQLQPACLTQASTGLVDCGNWAESASWAVPADAVSGIYIAKLVIEPSGGASHIPFVVRDDDRSSDLLFQTSDTTWQAYNSYGGASLYGGNGPGPAGRAHKVSYNRPFNTRGGSTEDYLFNSEYPMLRWLERNGYDVTYSTDIDTDRFGAELLQHKAFLSVGHDEYWTERMFENVTKARDAGVSLAFLSGNSISGVVELLPSNDGRPNRVMRRAGTGFKGEQELMGATSYGVGFADWTSDLPEHWAFEGTDMKKGDRVAQLVGWEYHGAPLATHPGLVVLSEGPVYAANGEKRTGTYATTLYTARRGNLVFNAGTCWWNVVLSSPPGFQNPPRKDFRRNDTRIQRITKNILDRMIAAKLTN